MRRPLLTVSESGLPHDVVASVVVRCSATSCFWPVFVTPSAANTGTVATHPAKRIGAAQVPALSVGKVEHRHELGVEELDADVVSRMGPEEPLAELERQRAGLDSLVATMQAALSPKAQMAESLGQ